MNRLVLLCVFVCWSACAHAPANLSPKGVAAFQATRVVKALDILRDTAVDGNAQTPPLISTATTRAVVTYHKAALQTIQQVPSGWQATVSAGLDNTLAAVPATDKDLLAPYVQLIKVLIAEVSK